MSSDREIDQERAVVSAVTFDGERRVAVGMSGRAPGDLCSSLSLPSFLCVRPDQGLQPSGHGALF